MCIGFHKAQYFTLRDLDGEPFTFFRGKSPSPFNCGRFFTNCFAEAKGFGINDKIFKTKIQTRFPLIIDATTSIGYYSYNGICIENALVYPKWAREKMMKFSVKLGSKSINLSTDELISFAIKEKDFDCVIVKNVREGILNIPVYDVMVMDKRNCIDLQDITNDKSSYDEWTTKRINLSPYISETEKNGIASEIHYNGYYFEDSIIKVDDVFQIATTLVIRTDYEKIKVYCDDIRSKVTGIKLTSNEYNYAAMLGCEIFDSLNGIVRIKGIQKELFNHFTIVSAI